MASDPLYIQELLHKYSQGQASEAEQLELFRYLYDNELDAVATPVIEARWKVAARADEGYPLEVLQRLADGVLGRIAGKGNETEATIVHRVHFLKTAWFRWAAILLLIAGTAAFLYTISRPQKEITLGTSTQQKPVDILPGGNKAILTLSDGSTIVLDSAAIGNVAQQGTTEIIKLNSGSLAYQGNNTAGEIGMNTINTPKGGQYHISLPDGSKVWLNAASSIRFPTAFIKERTVIITGEVYFEVAADRKRPFKVVAGRTEVEVMGTSFNVNAYAEEPAVKTTLLSGSVKVGNTVLRPGQAVENGQVITANTEQDLAWKNGLFNFQDKKLDEVMRQLARWYDLDIVYSGKIPNITLAGEMSRNMKLSNLLKVFERLELHYSMQGRTITILP